MANGAAKRGKKDGGPPGGATPAELRAAYLEAVALRDRLIAAYMTLCLYDPAASASGSEWQFELTSDNVAL